MRALVRYACLLILQQTAPPLTRALRALKVGHKRRDFAAEDDADLAHEVHRVGGPRQERKRKSSAVVGREPCSAKAEKYFGIRGRPLSMCAKFWDFLDFLNPLSPLNELAAD